jgi:hypothetical protein
VGRQPPLAGKGEVGRNVGRGADLGAKLIERCASVDVDHRDRGSAEFVGTNG